MMEPEEFPRCSAIWPGCLLASVAHAVFICRAPFMAHERSWDGRNYNVQDSAGSRATIAFGPRNNQFVAALFLEASPRNPFLARDPRALYQPLDQLVPSRMQELAKNAMDYLHQDFDGVSLPAVTSAFWSNIESDLTESCETWNAVFEHGASLIGKELLPTATALHAWSVDMDLPPSDSEFLWELFERRSTVPDGQITLIAEQKDYLQRIARGSAGLRACQEALREIQVLWQ